MDISTSEILKKITNFEEDTQQWRRMNEMYEYYIGKHAVPTGQKKEGRPDNHLYTNFAKNIVTNTVGYFMGTPVTYKVEDEAFSEKIQEITDYSDDAFVNTQLAEHLSIFGKAAELLYTEANDDGVIPCYAAINPMQLTYDTTGDIKDEITLAIRWYDVIDDDKQVTRHIEVYDDKEVAYFVQPTAKGSISPEIPLGRQAQTEPHYFGAVPIVVYYNNDDRRGDFEDVTSLIDAYNVMQSESVNDYQGFADAIMLVKNMTFDEERAESLREKNIIEAYDDADVSYLVKQVNDTYVENIKTRIQKDIYMASNTVNMSSEEFAGAVSGAAIQRRMMTFESRVAQTERYFKKGLQRRFMLICNLLNVSARYDYRDIVPVFKRNIPADITEITTEVTQLDGIVSRHTLLAQIPFVEDVDAEMEQLAKEQEERMQYNVGMFGQDDSILPQDDGTEPIEDKDDGTN